MLPRFAVKSGSALKLGNDEYDQRLDGLFLAESDDCNYVVRRLLNITIESSRYRHSNGGVLAVICDDVVCRKEAAKMAVCVESAQIGRGLYGVFCTNPQRN